eukprot:Pgem_evm1s10075
MSFKPELLQTKLKTLTNKAASIQLVATWVLHHRRAAPQIAQTWLSSVQEEAKPEKLYTFLCLLNEVLQRASRNGTEFRVAFNSSIVVPAFKTLEEKCRDTVYQPKVVRTLNIWQERTILDTKLIKELRLL